MVLKIPFLKKKKIILQNIKKRQLWSSFKFLKNNLSIFSGKKKPKNNKAHFNFNETKLFNKKK